MARNTKDANESWTISQADGKGGYVETYEFSSKADALAAVKELDSGVPGSSGFNACPTNEHKPARS